MPILIKNVPNKYIVEFDKGSFDNWCVYLTRPGMAKYAPRDTEYFYRLQQLGARHTTQKIYNDFVTFYLLTSKNIDPKILNMITRFSDNYGADAEEIDIWFTVIYAGMVAEENKQFTILKKRIKRLGMHQVLVEEMNANMAANFSRGKNWRELNIIMKERGF